MIPVSTWRLTLSALILGLLAFADDAIAAAVDASAIRWFCDGWAIA
jgi:hypothetical protein